MVLVSLFVERHLCHLSKDEQQGLAKSKKGRTALTSSWLVGVLFSDPIFAAKAISVYAVYLFT